MTSSPSPKTARVIWTVCCTDGFDEAHILRTMEQAAAEGVSGIEICNKAVDKWVGYRAFPQLRGAVHPKLRENQASLARVGERARALGLRLGLWHHEVEGPKNLLDLIPELRAEDGLIDLEQPLLYDFIREKCGEFLDLFPAVDEIVLTLTETEFVVAHRPFSKTPQAERIRRVLQAVADATEPRARTLVIRPFSAIRADELFVRDAVGSLKAGRVAMMYKTEPFDWNPFLPNEDLVGSVPRYEVRAETDGGAEYYGQADFPCCYARFIAWRLEAALAKGATVVALRVDRGSGHNALGHPLNEVNVIAPTRVLLGREKTVDAAWQAWLRERHGGGDPALADLLEQTFEVIKKAFYVNQQSLSHRAFTNMDFGKHILAFGLFEEDISLAHLSDHWSMIPSRRTLTHAAMLAEKEEALALAKGIRADFERLGAGLRPGSREAIADSLDRLPLLAEAFLRLCRTTVAHVRETTGAGLEDAKDFPRGPAVGTRRATEGSPCCPQHGGGDILPRQHDSSSVPDGVAGVGSFVEEAAAFTALADRIAAAFGEEFFRRMPAAMRNVAEGLARERALEIPLRVALREGGDVVDAVLCGFATEMHRVTKRLHTGSTGFVADRMFRATGVGSDQGFGYALRARDGAAHRLLLRIAGPSGPGVIEVGGARFELPAEAREGLASPAFDLPSARGGEIAFRVWSTTPAPVRLAGIELLAPRAAHA